MATRVFTTLNHPEPTEFVTDIGLFTVQMYTLYEVIIDSEGGVAYIVIHDSVSAGAAEDYITANGMWQS